jgi:hypothetical protein
MESRGIQHLLTLGIGLDSVRMAGDELQHTVPARWMLALLTDHGLRCSKREVIVLADYTIDVRLLLSLKDDCLRLRP